MEIKTTAKKQEKVKPSPASDKLIAVIRIDGEVKVKPEIRITLDNLRLRRKYSCIIINPSNKSHMGMLTKVKYQVAFGEIEKETLVKLIDSRAEIIKDSTHDKKNEKKIDAEMIASSLVNGKKLIELGIKPFFRLHPPRKGIKSKINYPKGVLGNNKKDINKLLERML
jgi:large subunit ribosomal protein L30